MLAAMLWAIICTVVAVQSGISAAPESNLLGTCEWKLAAMTRLSNELKAELRVPNRRQDELIEQVRRFAERNTRLERELRRALRRKARALADSAASGASARAMPRNAVPTVRSHGLPRRWWRSYRRAITRRLLSGAHACVLCGECKFGPPLDPDHFEMLRGRPDAFPSSFPPPAATC